MKNMKQLRLDSHGKTRVLYHLNYYDGPISGICLYEDKMCYFDTIEEVYDEWEMNDEAWIKYCVENIQEGLEVDLEDRKQTDWYRIYAIYETPDDTIEIIEENHQLFRKHVGLHCDYNYDTGMRGEVRQTGEHDKFYKADKRVPNLDVNKWKIICKFTSPF